MKVWLKSPALFYGLAFLSGIGVFYGYYLALVIGLSAERKTRLIGFYLVALAAFLEVTFLATPPPASNSLSGVGYFTIQKVRKSAMMGSRNYSYQGILTCFLSGEAVYQNLPCFINVEGGDDRPLGNQDYVVSGRITKLDQGRYKMHVTEWTPVEKTFHIAEHRFQLKEKARAYLKKHISDRRIYGFYASLATGEIENKVLGNTFNKTGLSHTLAISGLHYSWLMISLGFFLNLFLPKRITCYFLLIFVTAYFLFIGVSPSINRAWMAANVYLIGYIFTRPSFGLNALGVSLLAALIIDPNSVFHVGFQLSYIATFGILALYPSTNRLLGYIFRMRDKETVESLSLFEKHAYLIMVMMRKCMALTLTVGLATIPIMIIQFGGYPMIGFFLNSFVPLMVTIALLILLFAISLPWIAPQILQFGEWYTKLWLDIAYYGWDNHEFLLWSGFGLQGALLYLILILSLGIYLEDRRYELTIIAARG